MPYFLITYKSENRDRDYEILVPTKDKHDKTYNENACESEAKIYAELMISAFCAPTIEETLGPKHFIANQQGEPTWGDVWIIAQRVQDQQYCRQLQSANKIHRDGIIYYIKDKHVGQHALVPADSVKITVYDRPRNQIDLQVTSSLVLTKTELDKFRPAPPKAPQYVAPCEQRLHFYGGGASSGDGAGTTLGKRVVP